MESCITNKYLDKRREIEASNFSNIWLVASMLLDCIKLDFPSLKTSAEFLCVTFNKKPTSQQ